jgi:hypothetical protein
MLIVSGCVILDGFGSWDHGPRGSFSIAGLIESEKEMDLHFSSSNGSVDAAIERMFDLVGTLNHRPIVRDMIIAALKAGQENPETADLKLMSSTLKEMRYTAKVFGGYRKARKVTVFGSARTRPEQPIYRMAMQFGQRLAESGFMVISGGGLGIMRAVAEGAGYENSFGVNIRLPYERRSDHGPASRPRDITYKYFFNRKVAFIKEACAVALFPGGFGTLDEAMETFTLLQTGKRYPIPIVLMDGPADRYWSGWIDFLKSGLLPAGYISESDFALFAHVHSVDAAVAAINGFYRRYHSLRYIGEKLVFRLESAIEHTRIGELKALFSDIIAPGGGLYAAGPLPQENDEPDIIHLPRLVLDFNKSDFGRLRQFIDALNCF